MKICKSYWLLRTVLLSPNSGNIGYYCGDACVSVNGDMVKAAPLFSLLPVLVITATVDLDSIATFRNSVRSRCDVAVTAPTYPRVKVEPQL